MCQRSVLQHGSGHAGGSQEVVSHPHRSLWAGLCGNELPGFQGSLPGQLSTAQLRAVGSYAEGGEPVRSRSLPTEQGPYFFFFFLWLHSGAQITEINSTAMRHVVKC